MSVDSAEKISDALGLRLYEGKKGIHDIFKIGQANKISMNMA